MEHCCEHESCGCGCGHDHHHHPEKENRELPLILLGAGLFLAGVLLSLFVRLPLDIPVFVAAYLLLGWEVLANAAKNLRKGHVLDENFLMSIATIGAFAIGEFPEAVGIMLFYRIGEYFEHQASQRSRSSILKAVDLRPEVVTLATGQTIPAASAKPGDLLLVRPGDRIPLDATVLSGESRIDTAPITGEPVPVGVGAGNAVVSGCVNLSGALTLRVDKPLSESMVTRILNSVENAAAGKPKIDRFITRFARIYTPAVVITAAATAVIPSLIWGNWHYWLYTALSFLVMSCPCALVLSVPLSFFCGIGTGSKQGILFKSGLSMEALAKVKAVAMDKTGTITKGDFSLQDSDPAILALCASCEQRSSHPIAQSIVSAAKAQNLPLSTPETLEEIPGCGIRAVIAGDEILCGNQKLLERFGIQESLPAEAGAAQVLVAKNGLLLGQLLIRDTVKPDAKAAVARLRKMGLSTAILTGDRQETADAVAASVGISRVHARLLPEDKLTGLQTIREEQGAVLFVGDGINDAPVLAGADVGGAMGSGADAAMEAADVVFMTASVSAIPEAVDIARRTKRIAAQNVVFALTVKLAVMILGLSGHASMWAAVFADSGVAMLCVLNAVRMLWRKKP